jgi:hypothetical protein
LYFRLFVRLGASGEAEQLRHEPQVDVVRFADTADSVEHLIRHFVRVTADHHAVGADTMDRVLDDRFQFGGRAHDPDTVHRTSSRSGLIVQDGDDLVFAGRNRFEEFDAERGQAAHPDHHDVPAFEPIARLSEPGG